MPITHDDTLFSSDILEVTLGICEGPIGGLLDGAKTFYQDDTPLISAGGENNAGSFDVHVYHGETDASKVKQSLGGITSNVPVGVQLEKDVSIIRQTPAENRGEIDFLEVRLLISQLVENESDGDQRRTSVEFNIEYRAVGETPWRSFSNGSIVLTGKTTGGAIREWRKRVPRQDNDWEVRVTVLSDTDHPRHIRSLAWESLQVTNAKDRSYPNLAVARGLGYASEQFSSIPNFSGVYGCKLIKVPSNYDPETRYYSGFWDGTFKLAMSDSIIWCLYDMIDDEIYGFRKHWPFLEIDRYSFYDAAKWCDELVPVPGEEGKYQPRYTFSASFSEPKNALEQIHQLAGAVGGALVTDLSGSIRLKIDRPENYVQVFAPEGVSGEGFSYQYTDLTQRYNDITVEFVNPNLGFQRDSRQVSSDTLVAAHGSIPHTMKAIGCLDEAEAERRALRVLLQANTEFTSVNFRAPRSAISLETFDLIGVADPDMGWGFSARIDRKLSARLIFRGDIFEDVPNNTLHQLIVQTPTGPVQLEVERRPGFRDRVWLTTPALWPDNVPENAQVVLTGEEFGEVQKFRVLSIVEDTKDPDAFVVSAMFHNEDKFTATGYNPAVLDWNPLINSKRPPKPKITQLESGKAHFLKQPDGTAVPQMLVEVSAAGAVQRYSYMAEVRVAGDTSFISVRSDSARFYVPGVQPGETYEVTVYTEFANGKRSRPSATVSHQVRGRNTIPPTPVGWTATSTVDGVLLKGKKSEEADFREFRIYAKFAGKADELLDVISSTRYRREVPEGDEVLSYYVTQVNRWGYESPPTDDLFASRGRVTKEDLGADLVYITATTPPGTVQNISITSKLKEATGLARMTVSWAKPSGEDITHYQIEVREVGDTNWSGFQSSTLTHWFDVLPGAVYELRIAAVDRRGNIADFSATQQHAVLTDTVPPGVPQNVRASAGFGAAVVKWDEVDDADLDRYEVYQSTNGGAPGVNAAVSYSTAATMVSISDLEGDAMRYFWVRAVDTSGNASPWAPRVQAQPLVAKTDILAEDIQGTLGSEQIDGTILSDISKGTDALAKHNTLVGAFTGTLPGKFQAIEEDIATAAQSASGDAQVAVDAKNLSVTASRNALKRTAAMLPSDFSNGAEYWTNNISGSPDAVADAGLAAEFSAIEDPTYGPILRLNPITSNRHVAPKGRIPYTAGRTYRMTVSARHNGSFESGGDGSDNFNMQFRPLNVNYHLGGGWPTATKTVSFAAANTWETFVFEHTTPNLGGAEWLLPFFYVGTHSSGGDSRMEFKSCLIEDITESTAAAGHAAATAADVLLTSAAVDDAGNAKADAVSAKNLSVTASRDAQGYASRNLIRNGDFTRTGDEATIGWTADGVLTVERADHTSTAPPADHSLRVRNVQESAAYVRLLLDDDVRTSVMQRVIRISGWFYVKDHAAYASLRAGLRFSDVDNNYHSFGLTPIDTGVSGWQAFSVEIDTQGAYNAGARHATQMVFYTQASAGNAGVSDLYFTSLRVEDVTSEAAALQHSVDADAARETAVIAKDDAEGAAAKAYDTLQLSASISAKGTSVLKDQFFIEDGYTVSTYGSHAGLTRIDNEAAGATELYKVGQTLHFNMAAANDSGFLIRSSNNNGWVGPEGAKAYVVEVEFTLLSGTLDGMQVLLDWDKGGNDNRRNAPFVDHVRAPVVLGEPNVAIFTFEAPGGVVGQTVDWHDLYVMMNWGGYGQTKTAKEVKVHRCNVRVAADEETGGGLVDAKLKSYAYAAADFEGAVAAKMTELSTQMSGGRMAIKGSFEDGDLGAWHGVALSVVSVSSPPNGGTKALLSTARDAYHGEMLPGDLSGRTFRFKGYVYTADSTVDARIGFRIEYENGVVVHPTAYVQDGGLGGWRAFDVTLTMAANKTKSWRGFIQNNGINGTDVMKSYWLGVEVYDITQQTEIESTLEQHYLTESGTHEAIGVASEKLSASITGDNLVLTPTGNDGTVGGWTGTTLSTDVPPHAPPGARSLRVTDSAETPIRAGNPKGRTFAVSMWVKNPESGFSIAIRGNNDNNPLGSSLQNTVPLPIHSGWTFIEREIHCTKNTSHWAPAFDIGTAGTEYGLVYDLRWEDITDTKQRSDTLEGEIEEVKALELNALAGTALGTFSQSMKVAAQRGDGVLTSRYLDGWQSWGGGPTKKTYVAPNVVTGEVEHTYWEFDCNDTSDRGMRIHSTYSPWVGIWNSTRFTVEIDFHWLGGNPSGMGVLFDWQSNGSPNYVRHTVPLTDMLGTDFLSSTGRQKITYTFERPSNFNGTPSAAQMYFMANYGTLGAKATKHFRIHSIQIRPASKAEAEVIAQGTALADLQGNASASYVMRAKAGNAASEIELVSWDNANGGAGSSLKLNADTILLDGSVTMSKLLLTDLSNMLVNDWSGGNIDGWSTYESGGNLGLNTSANIGTYSWRATGRDQIISRNVKVSQGETYYFSVWVYNYDANYNANLMLRGRKADGSGTTWPVVATTSSKNNWHKIEGQYTIPTGYTQLEVYLQVPRPSGTTGSWTYWAKPTMRRASGAELIVDGSVKAKHVEVEELVVNGLANIRDDLAWIKTGHIEDLTADKITMPTDASKGLPIGLRVGTNGTTLGTIKDRANDPAARINANSVQVDPGKITIHGDTTLQDWRGASDKTTIDGGHIEAYSLTGTKIKGDEIDAGHLKVDAVQAQHVSIGDMSNLILGAEFESLGAWSGNTDDCGLFDTDNTNWSTDRILRMNGAGNEYVVINSKPFRVDAGEQLWLAYEGRVDSGGGACYLDLQTSSRRNFSADIRYMGGPGGVTSGGVTRKSGTKTMPSDAKWARIRLVKQNNGTTRCHFGDPQVRRMGRGELIVDGSIIADHLQIDSLDAISANLGTIEVDTANIANGSIKRLKIDGKAVDTEQLENGAATNLYTNFLVGSKAIGSDPTQVMKRTYTCQGDSLSILFNATMRGLTTAIVKFYDDGVHIRTFNVWAGYYMRITKVGNDYYTTEENNWEPVTLAFDFNPGAKTGDLTVEVDDGGGLRHYAEVKERYVNIMETKK